MIFLCRPSQYFIWGWPKKSSLGLSPKNPINFKAFAWTVIQNRTKPSGRLFWTAPKFEIWYWINRVEPENLTFLRFLYGSFYKTRVNPKDVWFKQPLDFFSVNVQLSLVNLLRYLDTTQSLLKHDPLKFSLEPHFLTCQCFLWHFDKKYFIFLFPIVSDDQCTRRKLWFLWFFFVSSSTTNLFNQFLICLAAMV